MARPFQTTLRGSALPGRVLEAVTGRLLGLHAGVLHSVQLHHGREVSYRSHRVEPARSADCTVRGLVVFGDSILAFGHGTLARRLSSDLDTCASVDLAGQSRRLSAFPRRDPISGELHLLAVASDGSQAHVVVSSSALTRRNRPIVDPPNPVADLAIAGDHVLFAAGAFLGIGARDLEAGVRWIRAGVRSLALVHAHACDNSLLAVVLTPSLERWVIHLGSMSIDREVIDPTPHRRAGTDHHVSATARPLLWTIGDRSVDTYDLATGRHVTRTFGHGRPGGIAFVSDPARPHDVDGGWLVGFVHDPSEGHTDLVLLDAADLSGPVVATARMPAPVPPDLHTTWIPAISQQPRQGDRS